jgi:hypothetical protein
MIGLCFDHSTPLETHMLYRSDMYATCFTALFCFPPRFLHSKPPVAQLSRCYTGVSSPTLVCISVHSRSAVNGACWRRKRGSCFLSVSGMEMNSKVDLLSQKPRIKNSLDICLEYHTNPSKWTCFRNTTTVDNPPPSKRSRSKSVGSEETERGEIVGEQNRLPVSANLLYTVMAMNEWHDSNKPTSQEKSWHSKKEDILRPPLPLTLLLEHQRIVAFSF